MPVFFAGRIDLSPKHGHAARRLPGRCRAATMWENQGFSGRPAMLSKEDNERLIRVGPGTPMGELMRRYWIPVAYSHQLAAPDGPPLRVRLLCENLVAFRDTEGRVGLLDERCPHRTASLFFGRNEENG